MMRIELEFVNKAAKTNENIEQNIIKAVSNFTFVFVLPFSFFHFFSLFCFFKNGSKLKFLLRIPKSPSNFAQRRKVLPPGVKD